MIQDVYTASGGSYETVKKRLPTDRMIEKFVLKFPGDPSFAELEKAMAAEDWDAAFSSAHTLKGVALNLAFEKLGAKGSELTDMLRPQNREGMNVENVKAMFAVVTDCYHEVIGAIKAYQPQ